MPSFADYFMYLTLFLHIWRAARLQCTSKTVSETMFFRDVICEFGSKENQKCQNNIGQKLRASGIIAYCYINE
jgi:hypothetical protein